MATESPNPAPERKPPAGRSRISPIERYLPPLSETAARWVRFLAVIFGAALVIWICLSLSAVLTPMVASFAIAYILNPAVTWLEIKRGVSRVTSVTLGLALLLLATGVMLFAGTVQVVEFVGNSPRYIASADRWLRTTAPYLYSESASGLSITEPPATQPSEVALEPGDARAGAPTTNLQKAPLRPNVRTWLQDWAINVAKGTPVYLGGLVSAVFFWGSVGVLVPMYTFFFLLHFNTLTRTIRDHVPERYRDTIVRVATTIDRSIANFFRGRLVVCLIVGTVIAIGWTIVRVPYSLPLGALAGLLNLIPFMSVLALPPALILTYLDAADHDRNWFWPVVFAMGVYMAAQALESFVLSPIVESRASGLHPVTTIVALLIGNQVAGLLGMLLAIPLASTLKSLGQEYVLPELRRLAARPPATGPPDPGPPLPERKDA